ncbi:MAG: BatD family protein [Planctomycetota bacterium]
MTVNFYVSANIGDFELNVPVFKSDAFDFANPDFISPGAKAYRLSRTMSEPVYVTQGRVVRTGRSATLLSFSKLLLARRPGTIEIAPVSVSADMVVGRSRGVFGFDRKYQRFTTSSESVKLTVLPLPAQGRPAQFYGLVGRYAISASATPTKVSVGDPITLTIKVGGSKYLKPVRWPALEQVPQLARNFKIPSEKSPPALQEGFKVFTQTLRANNDKVAEIPPIALVYFDPEEGRYEVANTEPIKLEVAPTQILTIADLEGTDFKPVNREVEAIKKGLAANYTKPDALRDMSFSAVGAMFSPGYALIWAGPFGLFLFSWLAKLATRTNPVKAAQRRRRQACGRAVHQVKKANAAARGQGEQLVVCAMKQYIGERFDKAAGSLTAEDCHGLIVAAGGDVQTADEYRDIIVRCEVSRYASVTADVDALQAGRVVELIRIIDKKSKR